MEKVRSAHVLWVCVGGLFVFAAGGRGAENEPDTAKQLRELQRKNELLQQQVSKQQEMIDDLSRKVSGIQMANEKRETEYDTTKGGLKGETAAVSAGMESGFKLGKVHISGEGGLALFHTESEGQFPNAEFRVDEAKLFVEAPIWKEVYFFTELNITEREEPNENMHVGELYLDFENLSRLWRRDRQLNLRIGRFDIPFGEEYLTRDAIDNPLISHSLSDLWGVDEGVELYGSFGKAQYVFAAQNGGHPALRDYNADKALVGRLSYDPTTWLHLSASAMRTGALDAKRDAKSELWFGNGFIRSLNSMGPATTFQANVAEGDVQIRWPRGHANAAGGVLKYDDNDGTANNQREAYYYYIEGVHHLTPKFYLASRWSQIIAPNGFPLLGQGDYVDYYLTDLTENLWRLSLGVGYRFGPNLLLKAEYTFEEGKEPGGGKRRHENLVAVEAAFKF